jgi:erythromycin esterase-like protein
MAAVMTSRPSAETAAALGPLVRELHGADRDYDALLDLCRDARYVLLGEASHGTHEFYRDRAEITRRLIREAGFTAVAVEADWPDAYRANCYVQGMSRAKNADAALAGFQRFPTWMWRNTEIRDFLDRLRRHNDSLAESAQKVGFYGLDLYSLHASIEAVLGYLDRVDPEAARRARARYGCFEDFGEDTQAYGYAASFGMAPSCEEQVVAQLRDLRRRAEEYAHLDGRIAADDFFFAEQNARLVANAEEYYRTMFRGRESSWNLRDRHMFGTLLALTAHLEAQGAGRVVVWAHNSHLGDARATEMGRRGELNLGQLVREHEGRKAVLVGITTDHGWVTAASDWGAPAERKRVRPGLAGSFEALFRDVEVPRFLLLLRENERATDLLLQPRIQRAIGVIYRPQTERLSHYFEALLPHQFDAVIHFNETRALEPLERSAGWDEGEAPETYPTGI